jgi:2-iminoacetate synthase ThiH
MIKMIEEAGRTPIERDSLYHEVQDEPVAATSSPTYIALSAVH